MLSYFNINCTQVDRKLHKQFVQTRLVGRLNFSSNARVCLLARWLYPYQADQSICTVRWRERVCCMLLSSALTCRWCCVEKNGNAIRQCVGDFARHSSISKDALLTADHQCWRWTSKSDVTIAPFSVQEMFRPVVFLMSSWSRFAIRSLAGDTKRCLDFKHRVCRCSGPVILIWSSCFGSKARWTKERALMAEHQCWR